MTCKKKIDVKGVIPLNSIEKARLVAQSVQDKKAIDPVILELRDLTVIADYFVICSGESGTQVGAITDHVKEKLKEAGVKRYAVEGADHRNWVLIDYGDVIVHIFEKETRDFYELEKLWLDAPRIDFA